MDNLLPEFETFEVTQKRAGQAKHTKWLPERSDAQFAVLPYYLEKEITRNYAAEAAETSDYVRNIKAPNDRYSYESEYDGSDPSPLSVATRGETSRAVIKAPKEVRRLERKMEKESERDPRQLFMHFMNDLPISMDCFVQKLNRMQTAIVTGKGGRFTDDALDDDRERNLMLDKYFPLHLHTSPTSRVTKLSSGVHEVVDFEFGLGPIGMEIEYLRGNLVCSNVVEDTPAFELMDQLMGSEIIAVNGTRVLTLAEFQNQVAKARTTGKVVLSSLVYRVGYEAMPEVDTTAFEKISSDVKAVLAPGLFMGSHSSSGDNSAQPSAEASRLASRQGAPHSDSKDNAIDKGSKRNSKDDSDGKWQRGDLIEDESGEMRVRIQPRAQAKEYRRMSGQRSPMSARSAMSFRSSRSERDSNVWDYATAYEKAEREPYLMLVCAPPALQRSSEWGCPNRYLQISNMSRDWDLQVFWVDEDGILISRASLEAGAGMKHLEVTAPHHVWCVVASCKDEHAPLSDSERAGVSSEEGQPDRPYRSSVSLLIRGSEGALIADKCVSLLWVPWSSVCMMQRHHDAGAGSAVAREIMMATMTAEKDAGAPVSPHIHLQVFDIAKKKV